MLGSTVSSAHPTRPRPCSKADLSPKPGRGLSPSLSPKASPSVLGGRGKRIGATILSSAKPASQPACLALSGPHRGKNKSHAPARIKEGSRVSVRSGVLSRRVGREASHGDGELWATTELWTPRKREKKRKIWDRAKDAERWRPVARLPAARGGQGRGTGAGPGQARRGQGSAAALSGQGLPLA